MNTQNEVGKNEANIKALQEQNKALKHESDRLRASVLELQIEVGARPLNVNTQNGEKDARLAGAAHGQVASVA